MQRQFSPTMHTWMQICVVVQRLLAHIFFMHEKLSPFLFVGHARSNSQDLNNQFMNTCNEGEFRQQIVAVGTPLPSASLPHSIMQAPVMLTNKNLQCMRAILCLARNNGSILGTSWHIVLQTLQHLVWILGLKPSTGGSLQVSAFEHFQ